MLQHNKCGAFYTGKILPDQIGMQDHNIFDMTDTGSILFMTMLNPTPYELQQMSSRNKLLRITCFQDCLWMTFKFGDLAWNEAPYSPHLSNQAHLPHNLDFSCNNVTVVLVDSSNGEVKYCDRLYFDEKFISAFKTGIMLLLCQEFDSAKYYRMLQRIQSQYSTEQIADNAVIECVLRHEP